MKRGLSALVIALLATSSSFGQNSGFAFLQKEVEVISALKEREKLSNIPRQVIVITKSEIDRWGVKNLFELLRHIPGFYVNVGSFGLMGVGALGIRQSYLSEKVQVLIDGHPITDPMNGSSFSSDNNITLDNVKRVEIIYGPMTSLYGANACLAVVNLITYGAEDLKNGKFGASFGTKGSNDSYLNFARIAKGWNLSVFSSYREDKGPDKNFTDHYGNKDDIGSYRKYFNFHLKLKSDSGFHSSLYYVDRDNDFPLNVFGMFSKQDFADRKALLSEVGYRFKLFNTDVDISSRFDWFYLKRGGSYLLPGQKVLYYDKDYRAGLYLDVSKNLNGLGRLLLGFNLEHVKLYNADTYANFDLKNPLLPVIYSDLRKEDSFYGRHSRDFVSAYIQHFLPKGNFRFLSNFNVEKFSDVGGAFAFNFSVMYSFSEDVSLKLNLGRAVRVPSFEELYLKNNSFVVGNSDLDFEKVDTFMVSLSYVKKKFSVEPILYVSRVKDFIMQEFDSSNNIFKWVNADEDVKVLGSMVSGKFNLNSNVQLYGSLTYNRTIKDGLETYTLRMPEWKGTAGTTLKFRRFLFDLNVLALSRVDEDSVNGVPGFAIVNTNFRWNITDASSVSLRVDNLFDKDVFYPVSRSLAPADPSGMVDYGRRMFISYEYSF